jgi:hypothetical protein
MPFQVAYSGEPAERSRERIHARLCPLSLGTGTLLRCQMRTCSPDGEQREASSRWVQCCAMQCMCERANKGSGKQITGTADASCKQGERGRRPTGKGLPCKAGMRTKGKNPLPRENLVTHLDRSIPYGGASVRVGGPSDTLGLLSPAATDSGHVCQVRGPCRFPRLYRKALGTEGVRLIWGPDWP